MRLPWTRDGVDTRLQMIIKSIHNICVKYGSKENGSINYVDGTNIGGLVKVADVMIAQGVV